MYRRSLDVIHAALTDPTADSVADAMDALDEVSLQIRYWQDKAQAYSRALAEVASHEHD